MQRRSSFLACLALLAAAVAPAAFAHQDSGDHLPPFASTGLDWTAPECGGDDGACHHGDSGPGRAPRPDAGDKPAGWYYGSVSAWVELQAPGEDLVAPGVLPWPLDGGVGVDPGLLFAPALGVCEFEVLGDGTAPFPADEAVVNGAPGGLAPDGTFNDGGLGAVCHTPRWFFGWEPYNANGCSYPNAQALDAASGEDVWITTHCDWLSSPFHSSGPLEPLLSLSACVANSAFGTAPGGTVGCADRFMACHVLGVRCPTGGYGFCGADGVADASESGQGDAGGGGPADGVPYPAGPFTDGWSGGACTVLSAAVFAWSAVVADLAADASDPDLEALSVATHGWVA